MDLEFNERSETKNSFVEILYINSINMFQLVVNHFQTKKNNELIF